MAMTQNCFVGAALALVLALTPLSAQALLIDTLQQVQAAFGGSSGGIGSTPGLSSLSSPPGALPGTRGVSSAGSGRNYSTFTGVGTGAFVTSSTFSDGGTASGAVSWQLSSPVDVTDGGASTKFILNVGAPPSGVATSLTVAV